jgi:hypothetical protein
MDAQGWERGDRPTQHVLGWSLPATTSSYYSPLRQEGGLSLGEGGDGSSSGTGAFSEGAVIADVTSDATDDMIQANIATIYGR